MHDKQENVVVEVRNISKQIGSRLILDQVDLIVPSGRIYGISGQNGAGKSILLRVISGLVRANSGRVRVFEEVIGEDAEFPKSTGVLIDGPGFLPQYSGLKNLQLLAMIRNQVTKAEIGNAIRLVGLDPNDTRPVRTYSTGMRQRLGLAQAIMEHPTLLLLDEPTSAIDREGRQAIYQFLKAMQANGMTILLTSHNTEELCNLCDAAFLMENGRLTSLN